MYTYIYVYETSDHEKGHHTSKTQSAPQKRQPIPSGRNSDILILDNNSKHIHIFITNTVIPTNLRSEQR